MLILKLNNLTNEDYIKNNGILSERYTLTQTKDLYLFKLDFIFSEENDFNVFDIEKSDWFSYSNVDGIGFWSFNNVNPLESLLNTIHNYEKAGLNEFAAEDINDERILKWINLIKPELLTEQYSLIEAANTLEHVMYVQRKLSELYQQLKYNHLLDPLFNNEYRLILK